MAFYANILTSDMVDLGGRQYRVMLKKKNYVGSAIEPRLQVPGFQIIPDGTQSAYMPIRGSRAELMLVVQGAEVEEIVREAVLATRDEFQVVIDEFLSGDWKTHWIGFCKQDIFRSDRAGFPYGVTITATDGLVELKEVEFPGNDIAGTRLSKIEGMAICLHNTGLNLNINTADNWYPVGVGMSTGTAEDPLRVEFDKLAFTLEREQRKREDYGQVVRTFASTVYNPGRRDGSVERRLGTRSGRGIYEYTDCYKVLRDLLTSKQLEIRQSQGEWWIEQRLEKRKVKYNLRRYNYLGEYQSSEEYDSRAFLVPNQLLINEWQSTEWTNTTGWTAPGAASITTTDADASVGTRCASCEVYTAGGSNLIRTNLFGGVSQGDKIKVSFDLKHVGNSKNLRYYLQEHDSGGGFLGAQSSDFAITDDWATHTHTFTLAEATVAQYYIGIMAQGVEESFFYMDNVEVLVNPSQIERMHFEAYPETLRPVRLSSASLAYYHGKIGGNSGQINQAANLDLDTWDFETVGGLARPKIPRDWTFEEKQYGINASAGIARRGGDDYTFKTHYSAGIGVHRRFASDLGNPTQSNVAWSSTSRLYKTFVSFPTQATIKLAPQIHAKGVWALSPAFHEILQTKFAFEIVAHDIPNDKFYNLSQDGTWVETREYIVRPVPQSWTTYGTSDYAEEITFTGNLFIAIHAPVESGVGPSGAGKLVELLIDSVEMDVKIVSGGEEDEVSEVTSSEMTVFIPGKSDAHFEFDDALHIGDGPTNMHFSRLTYNDTDTGTWTRAGLGDDKPLQQLALEQLLRTALASPEIIHGRLRGRFYPHQTLVLNGKTYLI
jgi:hypothetical protein